MAQNKENRREQGVSKALKTFFGVGDFGFAMMTNIDTFYANFFFTNIARLSLGTIATITTIASTIDALLSWVYGILLDKIKPQKWGRYRSWLILTPWLVPFLYAFEFITFDNMMLTAVIMTVAMVISRIAWNIPYVANVTMINIACKTPEDRMALSTSRNIWNTLAKVSFSYVGPAVVSFFAAFLGEKHSYAATAFAFAALMAAGYYAHFRMFDGYEESVSKIAADEDDNTKTSAPKNGIWASIKVNPHLFGLILASFAKTMANMMISGFAIYYFTYVANNMNLLSVFLLVSNLIGLAASYAAKLTSRKISTRSTATVAFILLGVSSVAAFLTYQNVIIAITLMCVAVFSYLVITTCEPALYADCAIYSEYKTGYNASGTIMGLMNPPIKVAIIAKGLLIPFCLALANFSPDINAAEASVQLRRGISFGFMITPAIAAALGALSLIFMYRLSEKKIEECSAAIAGRK